MKNLYLICISIIISFANLQAQNKSNSPVIKSDIIEAFKSLSNSDYENHNSFDRALPILSKLKYDSQSNDSKELMWDEYISTTIILNQGHKLEPNLQRKPTANVALIFSDYNCFIDSLYTEVINPLDVFNLFTKRTLIASAIDTKKFFSNKVSLFVSAENSFIKKEFDEILINWDNDQGFIKIDLDKELLTEYRKSGKKNIQFKITKNGKDYLTNVVIDVIIPAPKTKNFPNNDSIRIDTLHQGFTMFADIEIVYSCEDKVLRKPLIIIDGVETKPYMNSITWEKIDRAFQIPVGCYFGQEEFITKEILLNNGYDLVYVDWGFDAEAEFQVSHQSVENLSALLQKIILEMNKEKKLNQSFEKNSIIAFSLGGVASKFALREMEINETNHDVDMFLSVDSPFRGANVPLGLQGIIDEITRGRVIALSYFDFSTFSFKYSYIPIKLSWFLSDQEFGSACDETAGTESYDIYRKFLSSPVAKQLLVYNHFDVDNLVRDAFMETIESMGDLEKANHIAIVSGSLEGIENFPSNDILININIEGETSYFFGTILYSLIGDIKCMPLNNPAEFEIMTGDLSIDYESWLIDEEVLSVPFKSILIAANEGDGIDGAPGGVTENIIDFPGINVTHPLYCFIPSPHAINLDVSNTNGVNDYRVNISNKSAVLPNTGLTDYTGSLNEAIIDSFYWVDTNANCNNTTTLSANQSHVMPSQRNQAFLLYYFHKGASLNPNNLITLDQVNQFNFAEPVELFDYYAGCQSKRLDNRIDYNVNVLSGTRLLVNHKTDVGYLGSGYSNYNGAPAYTVLIGPEVCDDTEPVVVDINQGATLSIGSDNFDMSGHVILESGSTLTVDGNLWLNNNSTLTVEEGATLILNEGSNFKLVDNNTKLILKGTLITIGDVDISNFGKIEIYESANYYQSGNITINGDNKEDVFIELKNNTQLNFENFNVSLSNGKVLTRPMSNIVFTNNRNVQFTEIELEGNNFTSPDVLNVLEFYNCQDVIFNNVDLTYYKNYNGIYVSTSGLIKPTFNYNSGEIRNCLNAVTLDGVYSSIFNNLSILATPEVIGNGIIAQNGTNLNISNSIIDGYQSSNTFTQNGFGVSTIKTPIVTIESSVIRNCNQGLSVGVNEGLTEHYVNLSAATINNCKIGASVYSNQLKQAELSISCSHFFNNTISISGSDFKLKADPIKYPNEIYRNIFSRQLSETLNSPIFDVDYFYFSPFKGIDLKGNYWTNGVAPVSGDFEFYDYTSGSPQVVDVDYSQYLTGSVTPCQEVQQERTSPRNSKELVDNLTVKISPNPATSVLSISINLDEEMNFEIFSTNGNSVKTGIVKSESNLDISELTQGMYFIRFKNLNGSKVIAKKIVKI